MTKIIKYNIYSEEHQGPNVFVITKLSPLINPYSNIKDKNLNNIFYVRKKDDINALYSSYFDNMLKISKAFQEEWDKLYKAYIKYDTIYLGSNIPIDKENYLDVLIKKLKQNRLKEMIKNVEHKD